MKNWILPLVIITQISGYLWKHREKRSICFVLLTVQLTYVFLIPFISVQLPHFHPGPSPPHHFPSNLMSSDYLSWSWLWPCPSSHLLPFSLCIKFRHFIGHTILQFCPSSLLTSFLYLSLLIMFLPVNFSTHSCSVFQMLHNFQKAYSIQFRIADTCPLSEHSFSANTLYSPQKRKCLGDISLNYTGQLGRYQNFFTHRLIVSDNSKNTPVPSDLICLIVNPL